MSWTYTVTDIGTTTPSGRLNAVRLLIGDVDSTDEQIQDEEINFTLSQSGDNVYYAAAFSCRLLAAKYSRLVDTELDGALLAKYSDRVKNYNMLAIQMAEQGKRTGGRSLGISAGGIPNIPEFTVDQFNYTVEEYPDVRQF